MNLGANTPGRIPAPRRKSLSRKENNNKGDENTSSTVPSLGREETSVEEAALAEFTGSPDASHSESASRPARPPVRQVRSGGEQRRRVRLPSDPRPGIDGYERAT